MAGPSLLKVQADAMLDERIFRSPQGGQTPGNPLLELPLERGARLAFDLRDVPLFARIGDEVVQLLVGCPVQIRLPRLDELVAVGPNAPFGLPGALAADRLLPA